MARSPFLYVPLLAALLAVFWLHALQVPFWQDDFHLLLVAREAREAGESWLSAFWPTEKSIFWRPLSEGLYWRLVEGVLDASPVAAHSLNLAVLVAAVLAVAWLAADYAKLLQPSLDWHQAYVVAGLLYGIHAAHFLPAVWATAVHTSLVVLFSALALRFWIAALREGGAGLNLSHLSIPSFLLLALFSKESGILVLPLGALLTALAWKHARPTAATWGIAVLSVLLALAWLRLRQEMIEAPSGAYEMGVGANTLRNLASMGAFLFNVPRESLRFMLEQHAVLAALWALACAALQAVAFWIVLAPERSRLGLKEATWAMAFFLIACAPHLFFSWNSYAYYITLGLIIWPLLAALARPSAGGIRLALAAALLSSALSVAGNYALDYPSLLARAEWANRQLALIRTEFPAVAERARAHGIDLIVENRHKFLGIGVDGLAFTLELPPDLFREAAPGEPGTGSAVRLIVPDNGDAHFTLNTPNE